MVVAAIPTHPIAVILYCPLLMKPLSVCRCMTISRPRRGDSPSGYLQSVNGHGKQQVSCSVIGSQIDRGCLR